MAFLGETLSYLSSHSLFSSIFTLYTLIFLYFPSFLHKFLFSPLIFSTIILLLSLLRLGTEQNYPGDPDPTDSGHSRTTRTISSEQIRAFDFDDRDQLERVSSGSLDKKPGTEFSAGCDPYPTDSGSPESDSWTTRTVSTQQTRDFDVDDRDHLEGVSSGPVDKNVPGPDFSSGRDPDPFHIDSYLEWDVRAPLEIIYEEYEGEEAEQNENVSEETRETQMNIIQRYASLSLFYPESDGDDSSEEDLRPTGGWESTEEEEEDRDGLIEIALDEKRNVSEVDIEENLIEIDLSPAGFFR